MKKGIKTNRFTNAPPGLFFDRRSRIPGQIGHEQPVVEFLAAPWIRMGCDRRRPHVGPSFGRHVL